jgi:hypothetical protein
MGRKTARGCPRTKAVVLLGLLLFLAACAPDTAATHSDDNDKGGGFYTGMTGGGVHP